MTRLSFSTFSNVIQRFNTKVHLPPRFALKAIHNQQGFTYLMVMFFVSMVGISLMVIGQQWSVTMQRDREAELLFRGTRIKEAIERYAADFEVQKGTRPNRYPVTLNDLIKKPRRYLQKIYKDPMTGEDFELIKTGTEIRGIRSTSQKTPYDRVNFKGAATYHAIRFEATSQSSNCTPNPVNPLLPPDCSQQTPTSPSKNTPDSSEPASTPEEASQP